MMLFLIGIFATSILLSYGLGHISLHYYRRMYDLEDEEFASYVYSLSAHNWIKDLLLRNPSSTMDPNFRLGRKQILFLICALFAGIAYRFIQDVVNAREIDLITIPLFAVTLGNFLLAYKMWHLGQDMGRKKRE